MSVVGIKTDSAQTSLNRRECVLILKVEPSARLSEQRAALASPKID